ncbi:MAG: NAD/NADP octopine/nopaline dehydrogenase family protein [Denitrobacterium sp.]|jgi:opine dehydrogenase|nr:NAD/NADP octopine/nopaline dehydrogenase family protein [Denitrobacterium sp.]
MADIEALRKAPIAVLGGGAVGKTCAADCALAGQEVRICDLQPFFQTTLATVERTGITVQAKPPATQSKYGFERFGKATFSLVTDSVAEAVKGAKLIIVGVPSIAHEPFFKELIPHLEDGQIIHIIPDNYGSLKLRKLMREAGCDKDVVIGGWSSAPYGTRVDTEGGVMNAHVSLVYRAITLRGAALPMTDQDEFLESTKALGCFDAITEGDGVVSGGTVLDTGFSNVNPVIHVPGTVLGVSTMENFGTVLRGNIHDYSIYSHSFCPSISEVQYEFYNEEIALAKAIGVGIQEFKKDVFFQRTSVLGEEYMGEGCTVPFEEEWEVGYATGPFSIYNRYVTEDVPVGCHVYHELGKKFGVSTPIIDSMIAIAGVMTHKNYFEMGLTLEELGIAHLSKDELLDYLNNGVYVEA